MIGFTAYGLLVEGQLCYNYYNKLHRKLFSFIGW